MHLVRKLRTDPGCALTRRAKHLFWRALFLRRLAIELILDDAQRQKLRLLQVQDRLETLNVARGIETVSARGARGREQPLVLKVADLRDGKVGILLLEPSYNLAYGEIAGVGHVRYSPVWILWGRVVW